MKYFSSFREYFKHERFEIVREIAISVFISAIVAASLNYYFDVKKDERVAYRQFIYDFSRTFFDNPKYRNLSIAIENQYLYGKPILKINSGNFSEYDLDDYLSLLFDMWSYYQDKFISKALLDQQYSYYVCITYNNKEIQNYREKLIKEGYSEVGAYTFLDDFAKEFNLVGKNCKEL